MGDRIESSPYRFRMLQNESDLFLCQTKKLSKDDYNLFTKRIDEMYQVNVILDNLPAIWYTKKEDRLLLRWTGYPIGVKVDNAYYVFNHLKFTISDYAMTYVDGKSSKPFGRLWWDETVSTVVTRAEPHNQKIIHPSQDRVLTIRENSRLQGFPDYYKLFGSLKQRNLFGVLGATVKLLFGDRVLVESGMVLSTSMSSDSLCATRGIGTVSAGSLAFFVEFVVEETGEIGRAIFVGSSVFLVGILLPCIPFNFKYIIMFIHCIGE